MSKCKTISGNCYFPKGKYLPYRDVSKFSRLCISCLLFLFVLITGARGQNISFDYLSVEQGLSQHSVLSIAQDSKGFIWLGTEGGLNRYDGIRFKVYKYDADDSTSISGDIINTIFNDSKQTLWIGASSGLNIYNPQKDAFERISSIGVTYIHCIYESREGQIWIGSHNGLYLLTDRKKKQFQSFHASVNSIAGNTVRAIFEDHNGVMWIGTNNGLTKMQWQNGHYRFETFRHEAGKSGSLSQDYITSIAEDAQHKLWIGTLEAGVNLYDPATNTFTVYSHSNTDSSSIAGNIIHNLHLIKNRIWIGTDDGLSIIDPVTKNIMSYRHDASDKKSLSHNSVYSFLEDNSGGLWIGTYFGGVNILSANPFYIFQNNKEGSSLSSNVVTGIVEDGHHNLWIGTDGGGLNYFNRITGRFTVYKNNLNDASSLGSNRVMAVYIDKEGNIWIGTHGGGLCMLDPKTNKFKRYLYGESDNVVTIREFTSLAEDKDGNLWVAGNTSLRVFKKKNATLQELEPNKIVPGLPNIYASVLFKDTGGNIWVGGTFSGLFKISGNSFRTINGFNDHAVNCIGQDPEGNIWVGLKNGGLARCDETTGKLVRYGVNQGLSDLNIIGLLTDEKGNIWASTDNGLIKFNPEQNCIQTYTADDGLAGNEFNYNSYFKDSKGELFFGGFNGITGFFPDHIKTNKHIAPIVFTGLKLFNSNVEINDKTNLLKENIDYTRELTFKHNQNIFTIEFALLNFTKPDKNKYAYKLEGIHAGWTEINTPSAIFTNLPAGNYTVLVKGANNDGIWGKPAVMKITILPPFWLTWWAYCIYAITFSAILFFIARFIFLRALLKKEEDLHQTKLNFFTNISHEIRTHLTLIMAPIERVMRGKKQDVFIQQQLESVRSNTNRLLNLVGELMDFRKAETGHMNLHICRQNLIPFLQEIYNSFQELSLLKNISISFIHDDDNVFVYFDKEQLEKVFFNLLSNAFKFTPDGGRIIMNVEQKDTRVFIKVTDNGRGIEPQYKDKLFTNFFQVADYHIQNTGYGIGLALSKNIVELHKGTLTVESDTSAANQENTTCFTVTLLKGFKHFEGTEWLNENAGKENVTIEKEQETLPQETVTNNAIKEKEYHVLIIEDNDEVRRLIKETLHSYKLTECMNGEEGLQVALEQIPDLIVSDVMMPEMDGFELCRNLKTDERTSHIPVILLTAKSSQNDQVTGLSTGADIYLTKPFSTQVLELSVKNLLSTREKIRQKFSREFFLEPREIITGSPVEDQFLNRLTGIIEESMDNPRFGVEFLAKKMTMSQSVLYKKLKALTNMSVNDFAKAVRLKKAEQLLRQNFSVFDASIMTGFSDPKYFSKQFKKQFGKTPSEFIQSGGM